MLRSVLALLISSACFQHADAALPANNKFYLGSREGDPASIVENVSAIYGDYTEVEVDLAVAAPDSLVLSRFYSSRDALSIASFGGWRLNPHCFLTMKSDATSGSCLSQDGRLERVAVCVGSPEGSVLTYTGWKSVSDPRKPIQFKLDIEENRGITNTARGEISAWTNLKNNELCYDGQSDSFELRLYTQGRRFYVKNPQKDLYQITHEVLPSGNKIFYEFDDQNHLELIKETNAAGSRTLAWIKFEYKANALHLEASDGQTVDYALQRDPSGALLLASVGRSHKPALEYRYRIVDNHALLVEKRLPEGRFVQVEYCRDEPNRQKACSVTTPIEGDRTATVHFSYDADRTEVNGPGHRKSVYRFDERHRLIAIEQYLGNSLYRTHKKLWGQGSNIGNLIATSLADGNGAILYHRYFVYDSDGKGNVIEEREFGDIAGNGPLILDVNAEGAVANQFGHTKYRSYCSGENVDVIFQRDANGSGVKCWYKKGTNLLLKKLVMTKGSVNSDREDYNSGIQQRFFYDYNDDASLIRLIADDGRGVDAEDFSGVTQRLVTDITPKKEMPNVGAPEIIEQKYCAADDKSEHLIKRTINRFDANGSISAQETHDAKAEHRYTTTRQYTRGLLTFETDPMGNGTRYGYDANQNLISESRSGEDRSIEYGYDLRNRLVRTIERAGCGNQFQSRWVYDAAGFKIAEIDRFGNQTDFTNDSLGRPISITYPEASDGFEPSIRPTYTFEYDLFDNATSVTNPEGRILTKKYNIKGKPTDVQHFDGSRETFKYDSGGNLRQRCCRNGVVEAFGYDHLGRLNNIAHHAKGSDNFEHPFMTVSSEYSSFHKTSEADARGHETKYLYDGCGRLKTMTKGNQKVDFSYDSLGRVIGVKKWKSTTEFTLAAREYDLLDRVIEERQEDSSGRTVLRKRFVYNQAGELAQVIGYPQNQETALMQYEYDGFGRLLKATNAQGASTAITYDDTYFTDWGQRAMKRTLTDPLGNRTEEVYDNNGHLTQACKKDPLGKLLSCVDTAYDCTGNKMLEKALIVSAGRPHGNFEVGYSYTAGGKLESITLGKGAQDERITRFAYSSDGELVRKYYPRSESPILFGYNSCGDLESVSYREEDKEIKTDLAYDLNSNLISLKRDHLSVSYEYDRNDLPVKEAVTDEFGCYSVFRSYDGEGRVTRLTLPDGSYVSYSYQGPFVSSIIRENRSLFHDDLIFRVASRDQMGSILQEKLPGRLGARTQCWDSMGRKVGIETELFQDQILEQDCVGNFKKRQTAFQKQPVTTHYDYNALSQLVLERGQLDHQYDYDSIGNRLCRDGCEYKLNGLNELVAAHGNTYSFHRNGNIKSKVAEDKTWTFRSNPLNQITAITDGQTTISFTYDLAGRRLTKRIDSPSKKQVLRFFYLDNTEIGCVDEKGRVIELKIPSDPNNPEAPAIAIVLNGETYIPTHDLQGNIAYLQHSEWRNVVERYRYSAYGEVEIFDEKGNTIPGSCARNPWRYRGKRSDDEVGLIYFGYRYYDPEIGRWVSPDPAGTIDGINPYVFVRNNPLAYVDYFGLASETDKCPEYPECGCPECTLAWLFHGISCNPNCKIKTLKSKEEVAVVVPGSSIRSALCGIGQGVLDFMINSLHELQSAAVYIGSGELELSYYEREIMLFEVEQSQMHRMEDIGNFVMGVLGVDASDMVYRNFRIGTTLTLEVGSLAAGGYAAVKGVVGFRRLSKMPRQIMHISEATATVAELNRFHRAAQGLSEVGQNNIRVLRGWAKSKGWRRLPNPGGHPERWGTFEDGQFEWNLRIKPEASLRPGLDAGSARPRFDARFGDDGAYTYINPFTGTIGNKAVGTHIPLD